MLRGFAPVSDPKAVADVREMEEKFAQIRSMCEETGVNVPAEVAAYFDKLEYERDDWVEIESRKFGAAIDNEHTAFADCEVGCDVDIDKLRELCPELKILRVRVSL